MRIIDKDKGNASTIYIFSDDEQAEVVVISDDDDKAEDDDTVPYIPDKKEMDDSGGWPVEIKLPDWFSAHSFYDHVT